MPRRTKRKDSVCESTSASLISDTQYAGKRYPKFAALPDWVKNLDEAHNSNTTDHNVLHNVFGAKLHKPLRTHKHFWPRLIAAIISQVHHRPETTMSWINFHLLNLLNENKLTLPAPDEVYDYLEPYIKLDQHFDSFASKSITFKDEPLYRLRYDPSDSRENASITICFPNDKAPDLALIYRSALPEISRNTCLVITMMICLFYEKEDVRNLLLHTDQTVFNFLVKTIMQATSTLYAAGIVTVGENNLQEVDSESDDRHTIVTYHKIQAMNFALLAFIQCIDEFPADHPFSELLTQKAPDLLGRIEQMHLPSSNLLQWGQIVVWPSRNRLHLAGISSKLLATLFKNRINYTCDKDAPRLIGCVDGMTPMALDSWAIGNYVLGHQTYQYHWKFKPQAGDKYYTEIRPLTVGPIKIGFASDVQQMHEVSQSLHLIPGSICFDLYENSIWINQLEYIPKPDSTRPIVWPQKREQVIIGIVLDTAAANELDAVRFFVNNQEVNRIMDVEDMTPMATKPWTDPQSYFLSIAPTAYHQAFIALNREFWKYNREDETMRAFDKSLWRGEARPLRSRQMANCHFGEAQLSDDLPHEVLISPFNKHFNYSVLGGDTEQDILYLEPDGAYQYEFLGPECFDTNHQVVEVMPLTVPLGITNAHGDL